MDYVNGCQAKTLLKLFLCSIPQPIKRALCWFAEIVSILILYYRHYERVMTEGTRAPSQYKDHLFQVWGFPC